MRSFFGKGNTAVLCLLLCLLLPAAESSAYSVLTHEAVIDDAWKSSILPLLHRRFPSATPEELQHSRQFAYGGCIIQDMGYYPFGSKTFTELTHYVRSADFVENLIRDAKDPDEYAFALGTMAHYASDNSGHSIAVNRAVPLLYPKLKRKFGNDIPYAADPAAHLKTEFAYDVLEAARGRYLPEDYHAFVGFQVSKELLERAFYQTYGLHLADIFHDLDLAIGSYRHAVGSIIPKVTVIAWDIKKDEMVKNFPELSREHFIYRLPAADYNKEWGIQYQKQGFLTRTFAWFIRIVPKVGPLKTLSFKAPTRETERLFEESVQATEKKYEEILSRMKEGRVNLSNTDLDTGQQEKAGDYPLADKTYASLIDELSEKGFRTINPGLRDNILSFYGNLDGPIATRSKRKDWERLLSQIQELKQVRVYALSRESTPESQP